MSNTLSPYTNTDALSALQRSALMVATSAMCPPSMRKGSEAERVANVATAILLAGEMGEPPMHVLQSVYFISGKPGFSAAFMIGRANRHGPFSGPIQYDETGDDAHDKAYRVRAWATLQSGEKVYGPWVDWKMVKAAKWDNNTKYAEMPQAMMRYRSAAFFIRQFCPEVMGGFYMSDELQDVAAAERAPRVATVRQRPAPAAIAQDDRHDVIDAEPEDDEVSPADPKAVAAMCRYLAKQGLDAEVERLYGPATAWSAAALDRIASDLREAEAEVGCKLADADAGDRLHAFRSVTGGSATADGEGA